MATDKKPPFVAAGGFAVVARIPGPPQTWTALLDEALDCAGRAERQQHDIDAASDGRGGVPARRLFSSPGGPRLDALYRDPEFQAFVGRMVGVPVSASGSQGSYSYYVRPGDYLGLHRDIDECDVAVITCLCDTGGSGTLRLYPGRAAEPLSRIRATPQEGRVEIGLRAGQTIVLMGGVVPHVTSPMDANQKRIISALCYRAG
jgi:hypothetical protein